MKKTRITDIFDIQYPIIQGGMVWCSGWRLASAVSNAGGLGLLGAGSMYPEVLREHIQKTKLATNKPFGVNIPLLYPNIEELIHIVKEEKVPIVFTSAGSPKKWTGELQASGIKVAHVVSSTFFAQKCEQAGVDAIVVEGFEAGGHNGREETTTFTLIPHVAKHLSTPVIAAGGIYGGRSVLAAQILGAEGVQIGSRFAVAQESSAHQFFKEKVWEISEGETMLALKKLAPTRLIKNEFYETVKEMEDSGASPEALSELLGRGRAKKGIFEGDLKEGELEIGQIASMLEKQESVPEIFDAILTEYEEALAQFRSL